MLAVTLGETQPENLLGLLAARATAVGPAGAVARPMTVDLDPAQLRGARVVFTCERHAAQGARPYLDGRRTPPDGPAVIVTLPCVGAAPPDLLARALAAGAVGVRVIGCPPEDCANREGNTWAEQRLTRQRLPRLRRPYVDAPVVADWLPPDAFGLAFERVVSPAEAADPAAARRMPRAFAWRPFGAALVLVAVALLAQILLTDLPLQAYPARPAVVQLVSGDLGAAFANLTAAEVDDAIYRLELRVDGEERFGRSFTAEELLGLAADEQTAFFHELTLSPGEHDLSLRLVGEATGATFMLFDGRVAVAAGEIVQPPLSLDGIVPCPPGRPCAQ